MRRTQAFLSISFTLLFLGSSCSKNESADPQPVTAGKTESAASAEGPALASRVQAMLTARPIHGIPYVDARALGPAAVPLLTATLQDRANETQWPHAVMALGYIGDATARQPLITFLRQRGEGELTQPAFKASILVPIALGHLARNGDAEAFGVLQQLVQTANSLVRSFRWRYKSYEPDDINVVIAEMALSGIGSMGTAEAGAFLQRMKDTVKPGDELAAALEDAIALHQRVSREGPERVFAGQSDEEPGATAPAAKEDATRTHSLTVARHIDVPYVNATADAIFNVATNIIKIKDGPCADEVTCDVTMERSGNVTTFGAAKDKGDVITTDTQLKNTFAVTGNFKVVDTLGFCKGTAGDYSGCGVRGTKNAIVEADEPGDIWAHEFGHNVDLPDRGGCDQNIMHPSKKNTNSVDATECAAYRK